MWKKIGIILVATIGFVFSVFALDNKLFAADTIVYNSGGNVTGRVNIAPNGIRGNNIGYQKGDKILIGTNDPITGLSLGWQLLVKSDNYKATERQATGRKIVGDTGIVSDLDEHIVVDDLNAHSAWFAMTTSTIKTSMYDSIQTSGGVVWSGINRFPNYYNSNFSQVIKKINDDIAKKNGYKLIEDRNLAVYKEIFSKTTADNHIVPTNARLILASDYETGKKIFLPDFYTLFRYSGSPEIGYLNSGPPIESRDVLFNLDYPCSYYYMDAKRLDIAGNGSTKIVSMLENANVRPAAMLNLEQIIFGISRGDTTELTHITEPNLSSSYTNIYSSTMSYKEMKLRVKNSSLTALLYKIQNSTNESTEINQIVKDREVFLNVSANSGSSLDGTNTVSVLVFQHNDVTGNDDFKYYKPLEPAKGEGTYGFDTTGIPLGKYKIAIVNEVYNEASTTPADSSLISDVKDLEIVSPISNLAFTPTSKLKYNNNVNVSDTIGVISSSNGAGTPVYTLVADTAHTNDVTKFEIDSDGKTIKVKGSALDAGTYNFKIQAQDANGDPSTPLEIDAQVTVEKASPTITFDTTTKTVKTLAQAQTSWSETTTSTPSNDEVNVTYDISGGDIGVITIHPDTGAITPTSATAKGKVTIRATVDDNASTGKDNYETASTTKEIVIIDGVDGTVTPDSASSDTISPTFKATDANVKTGGNIATIAGVNGFFDNGTSGTITYTYTMKTGEESNYFLVNSSTGVITSNVNLMVGTYKVTVIISDKWSSKEIPITINVRQASAEVLKFYNSSDKTNAISTQSAPLGASGVMVFAEVKGSTNSNSVTYEIKSGSPTNVLSVHPTSGAITTQNAGTTIIIATKKGVSGQADAIAELIFTVTSADQSFMFSDVGGNELTKNPDGSYQPYKENGKEKEYAKAGTFQLYTSGAPSGAIVTYELKSGSPTDVISVDNNGLVTILNANTSLQKDKTMVTATSVDPSGNYADKTIEIPINIMKANPTVSFKGVTNVANGDGSVEPVIQDQDISSNIGGVTVNDTQYIVSVDAAFDSSIAWTNDGKTITYSYSEIEGIEVPLNVTKPGNRNYNSAEATGKMYIVGQDENVLEVSTPGKITYGDTFTIRSLQDDSSSTNVHYEFILNDLTYVKDNTQTNNQMSYDAIKASGTNEIEIKVKRTANGEMPLSKTIKVKVLPKDITMQLDNKARKVGESNPTFTYQDFTSKLISWNGVKDTIQPSDLKVTTTASLTSPTGSNPITLNTNHINTTYPNYKFKANNATLTINEDSVGSDWYHMEKKDTTTYQANTWVNQDVLVKSDHSDYTKLSTNKQIWEDALTISTEGKTNLTFYMKNMTNAISGSKSEGILIDKTKPKITAIKGKTTKANAIESFLNAVTFNAFYKPGDAIEILAEDVKPTTSTEVSGITNIQYKLYEKNSMTLLEEKSGTSTGSLTIKLSNPGIYKVCAIATDKAGNQSTETCEEIEIKKIDVDVDNDGKNDFIDTDNDGCPDLNILWKNDDDSWTKLNMDRNEDNIPDLNIDSNGDGEAELNIDTDNDGKPDLNLVMLTKADWKPTICVTTQPEKYCTGTSIKPQINVNTDDDDIPNINIDNNGDMKPDINITKPNETKPYLNITSTHSQWEPNADYTVNDFIYDTNTTYKALINVDSDGDGRPDLNIDVQGDSTESPPDGRPDINIDKNKDGIADENIIEIKNWEPKTDGEKNGVIFDTMVVNDGKDQLEDNNVIITKPGGVFLPNFALKVDKVTDTVSEVVKNDIIRKANGQIIEEIFDVKLLKDNVQTQPDGKLQIKLPLSNNLKNPQLVIEQADGTYLKIKPEIKDGFMYYESDFLGKVSVVKDAKTSEQTPATKDPVDTGNDLNEPTPDSGGTIKEETKNPVTSVKGNYYGGANTGDNVSMLNLFMICVFAFGIIIKMKGYQKK